jgi:hypothetical protein
MAPFSSLGIDLASQPGSTALCRLAWGERGVQVQQLATSDHLLDALVASLTAGLAARYRALAEPIPESDLGHAQIEGWIVLPRPGSLARLFSV